MSKATAPLFSFGARGSLGKAIVYSVWKGISTVRKFTAPSNPNTDPQQTQRGYFATAVAAWRNSFTAPTGVAAWNMLASVAPNPMSGFNAFTSEMALLQPTVPDPSIGNGISVAAQVATIAMKQLVDGTAGDEAGNFTIMVGASKSSLLSVGTAAIAAGNIVTPDLGNANAVKYVKLTKGGYDRSGIYKITLLA